LCKRSLRRHFLLVFERTPVWLLALEPSMSSKVYIRGVAGLVHVASSLTVQGHDHTLFLRAATHLGKDCIQYCVKKDEPPNPTILVSGSYPYLNRAASQPRLGKVLNLLDEPWKGKKTPPSLNGVTWQRMKPTQFGASISYPVLVGASGFVFLPLRSSLDRDIGHILDHRI
jgi:hypothetical protein